MSAETTTTTTTTTEDDAKKDVDDALKSTTPFVTDAAENETSS